MESEATPRHPSGYQPLGPWRLLKSVFRFHTWPLVLYCVFKPSTLVFSCPSPCISPRLNLMTTLPALCMSCNCLPPHSFPGAAARKWGAWSWGSEGKHLEFQITQAGQTSFAG